MTKTIFLFFLCSITTKVSCCYINKGREDLNSSYKNYELINSLHFQESYNSLEELEKGMNNLEKGINNLANIAIDLGSMIKTLEKIIEQRNEEIERLKPEPKKITKKRKRN